MNVRINFIYIYMPNMTNIWYATAIVIIHTHVLLYLQERPVI